MLGNLAEVGSEVITMDLSSMSVTWVHIVMCSRKKRPPSYFAVAAWTSSFILYFYNALDVSSPKRELIWLEVSIVYKSEKMSCQTIQTKQWCFCTLSWPPSLLTFFCSFYCTLDVSSPKIMSLH